MHVCVCVCVCVCVHVCDVCVCVSVVCTVCMCTLTVHFYLCMATTRHVAESGVSFVKQISAFASTFLGVLQQFPFQLRLVVPKCNDL